MDESQSVTPFDQVRPEDAADTPDVSSPALTGHSVARAAHTKSQAAEAVHTKSPTDKKKSKTVIPLVSKEISPEQITQDQDVVQDAAPAPAHEPELDDVGETAAGSSRLSEHFAAIEQDEEPMPAQVDEQQAFEQVDDGLYESDEWDEAADELPAEESSADELPADELVTDELTTEELSTEDQTTEDESADDMLSDDRVFISDALPGTDQSSDVDAATAYLGEEASGPAAQSTIPLLALQEPQIAHGARPGAGGWTIVSLCVGIGILACCFILPLADANRKLALEHERLQENLTQLQKQIDVNQQFLSHVNDDPILAERLAQRQMHYIRAGTSIVPLPSERTAGSSPFSLVAVPAPAVVQAPAQADSRLVSLFLDTRIRTWAMGTGLILVAMGLVLGYADKSPRTSDDMASGNAG